MTMPSATPGPRPVDVAGTPGCPARRRALAERGLSESTQWAVLTPLVLLAILGIIQTGIVLHGRSVAANAALAGAEAQSLAGAGGGVALRVAQEVATTGGLRDVQVSVGSGNDVQVHVQGRVDSFFPLASTVGSTATLPREEPR